MPFWPWLSTGIAQNCSNSSQSLRVERRPKLSKGEYIFCELPDDTIGGFPSWIVDPTKGPGFTVGPPLTSAVALAELRELLDSLHSNSQRGTASLKEMRREGTNATRENSGADTDEPMNLLFRNSKPMMLPADKQRNPQSHWPTCS